MDLTKLAESMLNMSYVNSHYNSVSFTSGTISLSS